MAGVFLALGITVPLRLRRAYVAIFTLCVLKDLQPPSYDSCMFCFRNAALLSKYLWDWS